MKNKLLTLLIALIASVGTLFAESGTCGENLTWDLTGGVLTISGTGAMTDYTFSDPAPWFGSRSSITSVIIENGVTSIGELALYKCYRFASMTIPNSVTSIGSAAFCYCNNLTSVTIPNSVTSIGNGAFASCSSLTSIDVASDNPNYCSVDGVLFNKDKTKLIQYPASGTEYTIPNSVTSIADDAFYGCSSLTTVTIPNSVTSIGDVAFAYCSGLTAVTIPNSVTSIGNYAFDNCSSLTSVTIPNSVTSIGDGAFAYCSSLTSVEIPNSVTSIGSYAFSDCSGLTSIDIPNSVTSIGDFAFSSCTGLTSVEIPNSVTSIGYEAFFYCWNLTDIYVACGDLDRIKQLLNNDGRVKYRPLPLITTHALNGDVNITSNICEPVVLTALPDYGYHFTQWSDGNTDNPRTIVLTQDTTFTAEFAIDKSGTCGANNELTWSYDDQSHTLTITGNGALTSNYTFGLEAPTQMTTLIIGDGVTEIGEGAFYGMSTINHLFIGANVDSIGSNAFAECRNFDDITCYSTNVPVINATTFANIGNKQYIYLYVPENRERAYQRDEFWGEFDIQIKGTEATTTDTNNVIVEPADNTALFRWPVDDDADSYSLQITKDGEVFCTLIFNSNGQLTGIAFAPSRDRSSQMPSATMSVSAMSFTVTGLDAASKYAYHLSVTDEAQNEIQAYSGEFATTGYEGEVNEGGEPEIVDTDGIEEVLNQQSEIKNHKLMMDGHLFILRDGKIFNAQGARVK